MYGSFRLSKRFCGDAGLIARWLCSDHVRILCLIQALTLSDIITNIEKNELKMKNKLSISELTTLFKPLPKQPERIYGREGKTIEYKQSYNHGAMARYFRTMSSFANAEGGYIIFGIKDKPREYIGLTSSSRKQFENLKIEVFTNNLNNYFQPEIKWEHTLFEFRSKEFGVIYTHPLENKPCVCSKTYDDSDDSHCLKEGDIYYRYRARSERIKYSELNQIFVDKERQQTKSWIELIQKIGKIGVANASLLDLNSGEINTDHANIVIDEDLLSKLRFVKEGNFSEKKGAPTLRLIGEISKITTPEFIIQTTTTRLRAIEQKDIVNAFLENKNVEAPFEYIKVSFNCTSGFQPIYYFLELEKMTPDELIDHIDKEGISSQTIKTIKERLKGRSEKYIKLTDTGTDAYLNKKHFLSKWLNFEIKIEDLTELEDREINWLLQSFYSIDDKHLVKNQNKYKQVIKELYDDYFIKIATGNVAGNFRKVLCRLDEVTYSAAHEDI